MAKGRGNSTSSDSSSSSPLSSSEDDQEVEEEEEASMDRPLEKFYAGKSRIDSKPATLKLEESSINFYFGTLLRDGEMSKEGREKMRDKYYLDPALFAKLQPPQLDNTKLSSLAQRETRDSNESRLASIHGR